MKNLPTLRDCLLVLTLGISVFCSMMIITWAKTKEVSYRPLVQDLRLINAVEVVDVLDQYKIDYRVDFENHLLYVNQQQTIDAKVALARIGLSIDYPKFSKHSDLQQAFDELAKSLHHQQQDLPYTQQPWFMELVRLVLAAFMVILVVVRPLIKELFDFKDEE
jgi:flagellar biosynthesis/type III secretory pathway M-ring protein FliF/YscJ